MEKKTRAKSKMLENIKKYNKIIIILVAIFCISIIATIFIMNINKPKKEDTIAESNKSKYTLSVEEVKKNVISKVNNGSIYIDDIEKVIDVKFVSKKQLIDNVELYEMEIEYEKSSLSAPIGQSYKGKTFKGEYCYAYNNETKQSFKYMFKLD